METINSPFLDAIQDLPGSTPGEKHRQLNSIARRIADDCAKSSEESSFASIELSDVPEPLVPLVKLEVAKILKNKEIIADALLSDDLDLVNRALRANWFFQSSNQKYINVKYFGQKLLPIVSKYTKAKIFKKLVAGFRLESDSKLAEEFYTLVSNSHGNEQAQILLEACSEDFIWNEVHQKYVVLSRHTVRRLIVKYPGLILRYVELALPSKKNDFIKFNLRTYQDFYQRLIKYAFVAMIFPLHEIYAQEYFLFHVKYLSQKTINRILKRYKEVIWMVPGISTALIPVSILAKKITKAQYKELFFHPFPRNINKKHWGLDSIFYMGIDLNTYSGDEKISLMLEIYERLNCCSMLEDPEFMTGTIMRMLPMEERVRQARILVRMNNNWREAELISEIWRCYLPKNEILPRIKTQLMRSTSMEDRSNLLSQWIYVCSVNKDEEELLRFLEHFTTKHRDEEPKLISRVMSTLSHDYKLENLNAMHWILIESFIEYVIAKNRSKVDDLSVKYPLRVLMIRKFANNQTIDHELRFFLQENRMTGLLPMDHPYRKNDLEKCFEMLPVLSNYREWPVVYQTKLIYLIVSAIYEYNDSEVKQKPISKMERLSLRNFKWVFEDAQKFVSEEKMVGSSQLARLIIKRIPHRLLHERNNNLIAVNRDIMKKIKQHEPDIIKEWFPTSVDEYEIDSGIAAKLLKNDPARILAQIYDYFDVMANFKHFRGNRRVFIRACRWHQQIPIILLELCLKFLKNNGNRYSVMVILMLLVERPVLLEVFNRIPTNNIMSCFQRSGRRADLIIRYNNKT